VKPRRPPAKFCQRDVKRAIKAATSSGLRVARVDIDTETGKISLDIATESKLAPQSNPLDQWLNKKKQQHDEHSA
jgi:hypothetical protein